MSQFLPCLKAWVSLRLFYDPSRLRQHSHACHHTKRQTTRNQLHNTTHHRLQPQEMEKNKGGMKMDKIPFNNWSKERIKLGTKNCTSRHKRYPNDKRVYWISPKLPWWFIREYLWKEEGANSSIELQEVIDKIYNREVKGEEQFYVHFGKFKEALP